MDLKSTLNRDTSLRSDVLLRACPKNDKLMIFTFIYSAVLVILSNANRRSTPVGAKVNGSRFVTLITLRVLEPACARCKNSNKFGFRSLTRSFALNLNRSLVFLIKSFFIVLSSRERTKAPGTEFCSRMKLCS